MKPEDIKPGMVFKRIRGVGCDVQVYKVDDKGVFYSALNGSQTRQVFFGWFLLTYEHQENPCDRFAREYAASPADQFQKSDNGCSHRNIREDRYFSAMVYKTCKDCGKTLN